MAPCHRTLSCFMKFRRDWRAEIGGLTFPPPDSLTPDRCAVRILVKHSLFWRFPWCPYLKGSWPDKVLEKKKKTILFSSRIWHGWLRKSLPILFSVIKDFFLLTEYAEIGKNALNLKHGSSLRNYWLFFIINTLKMVTMIFPRSFFSLNK